MSISDFLGLIAQNFWMYGGAFVIVLSILVFVHEFGHYYVARRCGVKIDSFSIGFGPELFGWTDKNSTRWKFSLIPLGGYVKMFGDTDPASAGHTEVMSHDEKKVAFYHQSVGKRAAIVFAGPAINFIFAIIVLAILYGTVGQPVTPAVSAAIIENSAADKAGFLPHDVILDIDGKKIHRFEDIRREVLVELDKPRVITVKRGDEILKLNATPDRQEDEDRFGFKHTTGLLGVVSPGNGIDIKSIKGIEGKSYANADETRDRLKELMDKTFRIQLSEGKDVRNLTVRPIKEQNENLNNPESPEYNSLILAATGSELFVRYKPLEALFASVNETINISVGTLKSIGQMIVGTRSATELGGIIRIGAIAGDMAKSGIIALVTFTALLSINLGLVNLFPIPMLDGGHLVFYTLEALKGSPIAEKTQEYAFRMGLAFLIGIMVFANLNDIMQLIL